MEEKNIFHFVIILEKRMHSFELYILIRVFTS